MSLKYISGFLPMLVIDDSATLYGINYNLDIIRDNVNINSLAEIFTEAVFLHLADYVGRGKILEIDTLRFNEEHKLSLEIIGDNLLISPAKTIFDYIMMDNYWQETMEEYYSDYSIVSILNIKIDIDLTTFGEFA